MILVTGGTGFLGMHLLEMLFKKNVSIRATYRGNFPTYFPEYLIKNIDWHVCDITDVETLETTFENINYVYHCANMVSFLPAHKKQMDYINVEGTANIVNACLRNNIKKLVHVSSVAALGRSENEEHITEKKEWLESSENSNYAQSKYHAEMEVWRGIAEGLSAVIVNPAIILGEGNWNTGSCQLFKTCFNEFPFYTQGITGWVDVLDVAKAMILLMESDITEQRFILCENNYSYQHIFTSIATHFNKKAPQFFARSWMVSIVWRLLAVKQAITGKASSITKETAHSSQQQYYYSNKKILSSLPSFTFTSMQQCIIRSCAWYKNNR